MRAASAEALIDDGARVTAVRPQAHDTGSQAWVTQHIRAWQQGPVAYVGDRKNRVPPMCAADAIRFYRLANKKGMAQK